MMYPIQLTAPMKADLTNYGFTDITTPQQVDELVAQEGTTFVVINSVCGCAAGNARPGAKMAMHYSKKKPTQAATVFAGVDHEAVRRMREHLLPYPPSSPAMALFKDGELVHFIERHQIEGVTAQDIARNLLRAFEEHCN